MVSLGMKRLLDLAVAAVLLAALAVPMAVVALAIRATMGAPVLFRQVRPGRGRKRFELCKFRTMSDARDAEGKLLPDHARLTPLGRWLRATSLDELPQLWNVVRGDMSLVGPRPLLCRYLPYFSPRESKRFEVRPGITGWAQIHGRNRVAWDDRLELDAWYIEHWSLGLDLRILIKTAVAVFGRRGTVVDPCSLMPDLDVERATRIERQNDAHRAAC